MTDFRHHVNTMVSHCVKMGIFIRILMDIFKSALCLGNGTGEACLLLYRIPAPKDI